mgnify:CR=1 FL=1
MNLNYNNILRILLIGLGSIGQRHLRLLKEHFSYEIFAKRHEKPEKKEDFGIKNLFSWKEVDKYQFDVAFICNPTYLHIETAIECAKRGMHLFIEKPIDCKLDRLDELLKIVDKKKLTSYVAYPLRCNNVFQILTNNLVTNAEFTCITDIRQWGKEYSWKIESGGGVLLELSHEIDLAQYLLGEIIKIEGKLKYDKEYKIDSEANLIITHIRKKKSHIYLHLLSEDHDTWARFLTLNYHNSFHQTIKYGVDDHIYLRQLQYFFDNLNNPQMMNNLFEASELFKKIIEFRDDNPINNLCP